MAIVSAMGGFSDSATAPVSSTRTGTQLYAAAKAAIAPVAISPAAAADTSATAGPSSVVAASIPSNENGGCGPEPARHGPGVVKTFVDADAGRAWLACLDRVAAARAAAAAPSVVAPPPAAPQPKTEQAAPALVQSSPQSAASSAPIVRPAEVMPDLEQSASPASDAASSAPASGGSGVVYVAGAGLALAAAVGLYFLLR